MELNCSGRTALDIDKTKAAIEDDHLVADLIEARLKMFALKAELDRLTFSDRYESPVKLVEAEKVARAKWNGLFLALRAHRRAVRRQHSPNTDLAHYAPWSSPKSALK